MSDKGRRRDIWKEPPSGSEGDVAKDFEPARADDANEDPTRDEPTLDTDESRGYQPKHRAPGRAPLIRRRRARIGDEETVSWETPWTETSSEPAPSRWTDEEEPSVTPPPRPIEEVPYLGPRRSEQKRRRSRPASETLEGDASPRSREYTGRHLAPKRQRWARGPEEEHGDDDAPAQKQEQEQEQEDTIVEGDIERALEEVNAEVVAPAPSGEDEDAGDHRNAAPADGVAPVFPDSEADSATDVEPRPEASQPDGAKGPNAAAAATPAGAAAEQRPEPLAQDTATPVAPGPAAPTESVRSELMLDEPVEDERDTAEHAAVAADEDDLRLLESDEPDSDEPDSDEPESEGWDSDDVELDEDADIATGPRRAALEERKKKKRVLQGAVGAFAVVAAIAGVVGAGLLVKEAVDKPPQRAVVPFDQPEEEQVGGTTLLFGTKEGGDESRGAIWMVLLNVDPENEDASIVYVPAHTAVEVPGRGLQGVGEAYGSGGLPLLLVSAENLLGINIDRYVELSDKDALVLFEQFETLTVDVPAEVRVPAGRDQARLIFVEGPQQMTPTSLVRLLYTTGIDGDDVELGSRHLAFWDQLLDVYDDPAELAAAFEAAGAALGESDVPVQEHARFMEALAATPSEDVTITALPVRPISAGDSQLYSADAEELAAFVEETIGTPEGAEQEVRVQLLNGNGVPGIGREAAAKLVGEGFRVILGGNARRLNYRKTLVIAYDSSDRGIALAERAKELLGVGEVQVSAQQQGIVDLTIVVGKDFMRAR